MQTNGSIKILFGEKDKDMNNNEIVVDCSYTVHAVIFGADESLLQINLKDGFSFKRMSLIPHISHLDDIFDSTDFGLRRDYETARINQHSMDVICALKEKTYKQTVSLCQTQYDEDTESDLVSLDNQIRIIRLSNEGPVRFKRFATHQHIQFETVEALIPHKRSSVIPISEAMTAKPISRFHCDENEASIINAAIQDMSLPFPDESLKFCHLYYDLSYHTEPCVSVTLLSTALEILFLDTDIKMQKKEILAKRCAVFIGNNTNQMLTIYKRIKELYKKRSEFVHEGKSANIQDSDIIELREYVRKAILKALSSPEDKKIRIKQIKSRVEKNQALFCEETKV